MKKILIWGTGIIAKQVILNEINGEVIGFIETNKRREIYRNKKVYTPDEIPEIYDYIIVANSYVNEIYNMCKTKNITLNKVIFLKEIKKQEGFSDLYEIKEILGEKNFTNYCAEINAWEESFLKDDIEKYNKLNKRNSFTIKEQYLWPMLQDKYAMAGSIGNYFWQDLWAAKLIVQSGIKSHFDIGSRIDGLIAHLLASNIEVTMIDVREFPEKIDHLKTIVDDATSLHQIADESIDSMSAMCSLEHFGLGRYGDPIDPEACFKCFCNIQKKLKKGGILYLSVPVGKERVEFNAHRVFYASTIVECFSDLYLAEFSCTANGKIESNVGIHRYDEDLHNGEYRYGLFRFIK